MQQINISPELKTILSQHRFVLEENLVSLQKLFLLARELLLKKNYQQAAIILEKCLELSILLKNTELETGSRTVLAGLKNLGTAGDKYTENYDPQLDFYEDLADTYLSQNLKRDSLYFFEEAFYLAKKYKMAERKNSLVTKIGKILNASKTYEDARSFYNFIFYNRSRNIDFTCQSTGDCCKDLKVNISLADLQRIHEKTGLPLDEIVYLDENSFVSDYFSSGDTKFLYKEYPKQFFYLKKKQASKDCIFLENNFCKVHEFKPLTCKSWPMLLNTENRIVFDNLSYLKDKCGYCVVPEQNDEEKLKKDLRLDYNNWCMQEVVKNKLKKLLSQNKNYTEKEIFELFITLNKKHEQHIAFLNGVIAASEQIIKVISTFSVKKETLGEYSSEPRIIAYTTGVPGEAGEKIFTQLKGSPGVNLVKATEGNTDLKVVMEPNFVLRVLVLPVSELKAVPQLDEVELYRDEGFNFPEPAEEPEIPISLDVYAQTLTASARVIKYSLRLRKYQEAREALENILLLYKKAADNAECQGLINDSLERLSSFYRNKLPEFAIPEEVETEQKFLKESILASLV